MNLSGLLEPSVEDVIIKFIKDSVRNDKESSWDTKSVALISIAVSLRRIANYLEPK